MCAWKHFQLLLEAYKAVACLLFFLSALWSLIGMKQLQYINFQIIWKF